MTVTTSETQERARTARKLGDGPRRAGLLDTAALCFGELGYDAVTVETITTRADVSRATFYAYFSSKDEVFRAVAEMMCRRFLDAQHMEGPAAEDLREVLRTTTSAFITAVYT
ncbi:TetR/AcrR family transcriptional regulator, partial [Rhodococcus erythropolis]